MPERYGSRATLHNRFRRWAKNGTFERTLRAARTEADAAGGIEWLGSADFTIVRAHQHAAGTREGGLRTPGLGRSKGGPTSKIHLACDGAGRRPVLVTADRQNGIGMVTAVEAAQSTSRPASRAWWLVQGDTTLAHKHPARLAQLKFFPRSPLLGFSIRRESLTLRDSRSGLDMTPRR
jgi:hypothetical protein